MVTVNILDASMNLSSLLAVVERGETVRICRDGVAVAELKPVPHGVPNPLAADSPLRALAGVTSDPAALERPLPDGEDFGTAAWNAR